MKLLEKNFKAPKQDIWGFNLIWVPFGKRGDIVDKAGNVTKVIKLADVLNPSSLNTLAGIPVYLFHPEQDNGAVSVDPDNFNSFKAVGVCTDKYRLVDGGGEVQVKLTDPATYPEILAKQITHVSPCYTEINGFRTYNHIALLPPNMAKGGEKMFISIEGFSSSLDCNYFTGVNVPESYNPIYQLTNKNKYNIMDNIEQLLGQLLAGQSSLCESFNGYMASMKAEKEAIDCESVDMESKEKAVFSEGFEAGIEAGKVLSIATQHGYEGSDVNEGNLFVIKKAYPSLSIEGFSAGMLSGAYKTAVETLKQVTNSTAPVVSAVVQVPVVEIKSAPVKSSRMKISA